MRRFLACWVGVAACCVSSVAKAGPTGLINMPDARFNPDGTLRFGMAYARPYFDLSANATLLPWLETNLAVIRITGVPGFNAGPNGFGPDYGAYKDKNAGFKIRLVAEGGWWPAVAVGAQDPFGTSLFPRQFAVATKTLGDAQVTLGYGRRQIDGAFGGLRYSPSWLGNWSFVSEYDASDYKNFPFAEQSQVSGRTRGISNALEYRIGWMTAAVSNQRGVAGISTYVSIPLEQKEWIPKTAEPEPYVKVIPRPTLAQWEQDPGYPRRMYQALFRQDFKDVRIRMEPNARLSLTLANSRISQMSRAVGRAARTALLLAPIETTAIRVTYTTSGLPVATYEFSDLRKLNRYFNGLLTRSELAESVSIRYADPSSYSEKDKADLMAALEEPAQARLLYARDEGNFISFKSQDNGLNLFQIRPTLSSYVNGPKVFQYSFGLFTTYDRELAERLSLNTGLNAILYENITEAIGSNNSTLPHVRSDFGEYAKAPRLRVDHVLLNRVYQPSERTYARLTGGWLEQMYGGVGGQWLYVERGTPWAFDLSVDAVRQRDFHDQFAFRDYQTVTALAAMHYKLPYQSTFTLRAGRFLARDYGARFEIKRRFRIGMELGAWYTVTNALDTGVNPGNYRDKGVFVSIPFEALLTNDTRVVTGFSIAPWTRDVGQMLNSPVDLYQMLEKPLMLDLHDRDGLLRFGDVEDDYNLPYLGNPMWDRPFENLGGMTARDWGNGAGALSSSSAWETALLGAGVVLGSAVFDRSVSRSVDRHSGSRALDTLDGLGKWLPVAALAGAGLAALSEQDKRLSNTGIAAIQAGATGLFANLGIKYAVGRARPADEKGPADFEPFKRSDASFPSNHATVTWAAVTPFAREYDAPWLYGVAALANAGRIASREHWLSDTVASSLLGFAIGDFFWQERRKPDDKAPKVLVGRAGVTLMWETR